MIRINDPRALGYLAVFYLFQDGNVCAYIYLQNDPFHENCIICLNQLQIPVLLYVPDLNKEDSATYTNVSQSDIDLYKIEYLQKQIQRIKESNPFIY